MTGISLAHSLIAIFFFGFLELAISGQDEVDAAANEYGEKLTRMKWYHQLL